MIGFIVTAEAAATVAAAVEAAQVSRGIPPYFGVEGMLIHSGPHAEMYFLPFPDEALETPLRGNSKLPEYEEYIPLMEMLGGLSARTTIDPEQLIEPQTPQMP